MRIRCVKNIEEKLLSNSDVILLNPSEELIQKTFKNKTIHLEIGMGKGKFIQTKAKLNKDIFYIGCELNKSVLYKASCVKIDNLKYINYNALELDKLFSSLKVQKIYLNFSDPWPKTRHEKRRLTSSSFLDVYKKILVNDGIIEFKTDNEDLFTYSVIKFNEAGFEFLDLKLDLHKNETNVITTEYEDKFILKNQKIYYIKVRVKND